MTAPSLYLTSEPRAALYPLGGLFFRPRVHARANECGSFAPILLGFALHGRCIGVLHFEPIGRAAGTVGRVLALRDDTFEAKLACVGEDGWTVAFHVVVEPDAGASLGHDGCERGLADLKWIAPQIIAVQLDEVEGIEEYAPVSALVTDEVKRGNAVVIAGDSFAVDDAGARPQACQRLNDQREATSEVIAGTAVEPHLRAVLAGNDAEAVALDLSQYTSEQIVKNLSPISKNSTPLAQRSLH